MLLNNRKIFVMRFIKAESIKALVLYTYMQHLIAAVARGQMA